MKCECIAWPNLETHIVFILPSLGRSVRTKEQRAARETAYYVGYVAHRLRLTLELDSELLEAVARLLQVRHTDAGVTETLGLLVTVVAVGGCGARDVKVSVQLQSH